MKTPKLLLCCAIAAMLLMGCNKNEPTTPGTGSGTGTGTEVTVPARNGQSGISYQILVYSFADSDGDGCGDFKGIEQRLDYLKGLGVTALWLSPIHPASSYHGYDVLDYSAVNPGFGSEADLQSLIDAAHEEGIKIYLDYVLNHTSKDHPWFLDAKSSADSPCRDYYIFSDDPRADIAAGKIEMIATEGSSGYDSGQWYSAVSGTGEAQKIRFTLSLSGNGAPASITAEQVEEISNSGTQDSGIWLYYGDEEMEEFYTATDGSVSLSLELSSSWGVLVRTSTTEWDNHKYGAAAGSNRLSWGEPLALVAGGSSADILLPDMTTTMYHSHMWTSYFADLNYGSASDCENSPAFKAVCESADKWIKMGVDGFRLDAIKHIYHNASSDENPTFLRKFYDHCNSTYKAAGGSGDIYMVGEHLSAYNEVAPYYTGLPAFFDFSFWWTLRDAINNGNGSNFVGTIQGYRELYGQYRSDFIEATKLSNHDENRTGSELGRSTAKMRLAGAVLLTGPGEPYIYQGEELGYWGEKNNGDEYVRTPIMWNADGSNLASAALSGKVDNAMLTSAMSVESQSADNSSVLSTYRTFGVLRDSYEALSKGSFDYCASVSNFPSVAAWYRTYGEQRILVVHNFGGGTVNLSFASDNLTRMIGSNGSATTNGSKLTLGAYSSALFLQ